MFSNRASSATPAESDIQFLTQRSVHRRRCSSSASSCTAGRSQSDDEETDAFIHDVIDLTNDTFNSRQQTEGRDLAVDVFQVGGETIRLGDFVEINNSQLGSYPVNFIIVKAILRKPTGQVVFRGQPYTRNRNLGGKLAKKPNEVCQLLHLDHNDADEQSPALLHIDMEDILAKRSLVRTNAIWPRFNAFENQIRAQEHAGTYVCRWKFKICTFTRGRKSKAVEEALIRLSPFEASRQIYRVDELLLSLQWRGERVRGGTWKSNKGQVDLTMDDSRVLQREVGQKYTVFDSFSGAGGVSRGACMAGFRVLHAVDKAEEVWPTYKANFRDTRLFCGSVDEFIQSERQHIRVDILHLSPPCQYFSPAHTREAGHDDQNIFALFSCNSLVSKVRPRIITVEQTFGITQQRHLEYLRILISDFTQFGYSVRWKVVRLCTWGSAQDRKRLIIIAAAPGERLPPFPAATHSESGEGGLRPYLTIGQALHSVRLGDELHDLERTKRYAPPRRAYDDNRLAGTITTGGSEFAHPSGTRDFTLREFASLQGFPRYHKFKGTRTSIKRQIGNAFPPNTVKVLFSHLEKWLLKTDSMTCPRSSATEVIAMGDGPNDERSGRGDDLIIVDDSDGSSLHSTNGSNRPPSTFSDSDDVMEIDSPDDLFIVDCFSPTRAVHSSRVTIDLTRYQH
jgi:DNA (cytosine-5)-methyltransferase 1